MFQKYVILRLFVVISILIGTQIYANETGLLPYVPQSLQSNASHYFPHCLDPRIQLLVIAPNNNATEFNDAMDVVHAGRFAHLATLALFTKDATRKNILNAMKCPRLRGVFYVGDGNMNLIGTYDGVITSDDFKQYFAQQFNHRVVVMFSSADGFQEPLRNTMTTITQTQKYLASDSAIYLGYADKTASCTMTAIIMNPARNINDALSGCEKAYGSPGNYWEVAGDGSDYFGK